MSKLQRLLAKGHLVPIYKAEEDTIFLIGYQRKPSSRKSHQRPFMLNQPLALGKIEPNPEAEPVACDSSKMSQNNINEE
jgi:hypothetical protein